MADEAPATPAAEPAAPAAPAAAAPAAEPAKEAPKAPGIDPSEAGRILANAKRGIGKAKEAKPAAGKEKATDPKAPPAPTAADKSAAAPSKQEPSTSGSSTGQADPAAASPSAKPVRSTEDEAAERLAALVQQDRATKAERAKLEAERKAFEAEAPVLKAIREAREKNDTLGVLRAAYGGDADLAETAFWDLLGALKGKEDAPAFDPAKVPELVEKTIEEREAKAKAAQSEAIQRDVSEAAAAYAEACNVELKKAPDKYPLVRRRGIAPETMDKYIRDTYAKTRQVPDADAALAHFEARFVKELEGTPYAPKPPAPAPAPAPTVNGSWTRDGGAKTQPEGKPPSLAEKTEALRQRLQQMDRERARGAA